MPISTFDLFTIGIGPSSSHTVGPMRAAKRFAEGLAAGGLLPRTRRVRVELFGSLGATGRGHGSDRAVLLGLEGEDPETVDPASIPSRLAALEARGRLRLGGIHEVVFAPRRDLVFHKRKSLPGHPNGMRYVALDAEGTPLQDRVFYSIGGGFIVEDGETDDKRLPHDPTILPHPFTSGAELLSRCQTAGLRVSSLMRENERVWRADEEILARLDAIADAMRACVQRGMTAEGILPGGLGVRRRAPLLHRKLLSDAGAAADPLAAMDWVNLYAIAVSEENAAGGRVVTAPTNGAAGIIPAVLHFYERFCPNPDADGVRRLLLTAAAIGIIFKTRASISGAEVGCQGEVGVACSMAAAGLTEALGGTPAQVACAAEIAMEHNLGLTCDPVGGLVQIPCIERNAMWAVKAINASRLALRGDGSQKVSLDQVIETMRQTGRDMKTKYKETARGGLAVNIVEC